MSEDLFASIDPNWGRDETPSLRPPELPRAAPEEEEEPGWFLDTLSAPVE